MILLVSDIFWGKPGPFPNGKFRGLDLWRIQRSELEMDQMGPRWGEGVTG